MLSYIEKLVNDLSSCLKIASIHNLACIFSCLGYPFDALSKLDMAAWAVVKILTDVFFLSSESISLSSWVDIIVVK